MCGACHQEVKTDQING